MSCGCSVPVVGREATGGGAGGAGADGDGGAAGAAPGTGAAVAGGAAGAAGAAGVARGGGVRAWRLSVSTRELSSSTRPESVASVAESASRRWVTAAT